MSTYISVFIVTCIIATVENHSFTSMDGSDRVLYKRGALPLILILCLWTAVMALRGLQVGTDTFGYYHHYLLVSSSNTSLKDYLSTQRDSLFGVLLYVCGRISNGNWFFFQICVGLLSFGPVLAVFRNRSNDVMLSCSLFLGTMAYYTVFNGMRQAIAVSLCFYAFCELFQEKRYFRYAILMYLAIGFHATAVFAIPAHLFSQVKRKSSWMTIISIVVILIYVFMWQVWGSIVSLFNLVGQEKLAFDYANASQNGSSLLRFLVALAPIFVGQHYYYRIKEENGDIDGDLIMCFIAAVFSLFSMRYWLFSRVGLYFSIMWTLFLPKCVSAFGESNKRVVRSMIIIMYFLYMIVLLAIGEGGLIPYTFFSRG